MTNTYIPLLVVRLAAQTSSVSFFNIDTFSNYRDLVIGFNGSVDGGNDVSIRFNNDQRSIYGYTNNFSSGTGFNGFQAWSTQAIRFWSFTNGPTNFEANIFEHQTTNKFKHVFTKVYSSNAANNSNWSGYSNGYYGTELAISRIDVFSPTQFTVNSVFTLYGIM